MMSAEKMEILAASWLAREDRSLTPEEQAALSEWLGQSALHKVTYLRLKAVWQRADRLAAIRRPVLHRSSTVLFGLRPFHAIAATILAALVFSGTYLAYHLLAHQLYATDLGQMQAVRLADGTRMELNTKTRVHAEITRTLRTVTLDEGEAYFDVVHDANRPFVVIAGNRRITDIGTKFSVFRNGDDVQVVVKEGRVRVDILNGPSVVAPLFAEGGRVVISKAEETLVVAKPAQDIANDLSWRRGMLVFNQQTLAEVADQFNRYNKKQIIVEGNARKIRIGGSFKADNVDVFALLIRRGFGLSVSDHGNNIVISN